MAPDSVWPDISSCTGQPARGLPAGSVEARTDFGSAGYGGPCPPEGDAPHHYIFTIHALKEPSLPLNGDTPSAQVGYYLHFATIAKASFTVTYGK